MAEEMKAVNAAYLRFQSEYPEAANYLCFLAGWVASQHHTEENHR